MLQMSKTVWVENREFVERLKPDDNEFLAIAGIMFWTFGMAIFYTSYFDILPLYTDHMHTKIYEINNILYEINKTIKFRGPTCERGGDSIEWALSNGNPTRASLLLSVTEIITG